MPKARPEVMHHYPKAPRWINTEAGNWAWQHYGSWRGKAVDALSIEDRRNLLSEAEQLRKSNLPMMAE